MIKIKHLLVVLLAMIVFLVSCSSTEDYLVETNSQNANINNLPEEYQSYDIKQFAKGDYVSVKKLEEKDFYNLKVGDVLAFYDKTLSIPNHINFHRIVYIVYTDEQVIQSISVQGDYSVEKNGKFDPADASKTTSNYYLQSSGDVQTFTVNNILDIIKGKVVKVKYSKK